MFKQYYFILLIIGYSIGLSSCVNTNKAIYFNNLKDTVINSTIINLEPVIQKGDVLSIVISSMSVEATQIFNVSNAQPNSSTTNLIQPVGYLVDQEGYIFVPVLGKINAVGLTKKDLKDIISTMLIKQKYLLNPLVDIRYMNYKVTVLGEVARPAVFNVPNEKITLLEALGFAGDLTIFAKRNNVLVIRELNNEKVIKRIDLNSSDFLTSPYYYLQSNDIVYVEPNKAKVASANRMNQWLPVLFSGLSVTAIVIDRLTR